MVDFSRRNCFIRFSKKIFLTRKYTEVPGGETIVASSDLMEKLYFLRKILLKKQFSCDNREVSVLTNWNEYFIFFYNKLFLDGHGVGKSVEMETNIFFCLQQRLHDLPPLIVTTWAYPLFQVSNTVIYLGLDFQVFVFHFMLRISDRLPAGGFVLFFSKCVNP